ncbi:hypothetical protein KFE25_000770 [Diacronema lutheri]|uniref:Uncharacterized protein n=1 Tax=Diacronema lutheri TaxID=2081491 RepID=A0A8J6CCD6_DIALT|nr:hypothetical protein KFE25_000770 [Diacronema lutheri]
MKRLHDDVEDDEQPPGTAAQNSAKRGLDNFSTEPQVSVAYPLPPSDGVVGGAGGPVGASAPANGQRNGIAAGALIGEITVLKGEINTLEAQLGQLQEKHARLSAEHTVLATALPKSRPPHDPSWEVHTNPTNGAPYYFNKRTSASTYERPVDYNPRPKPDLPTKLMAKGPPGANLFVVRKMRRGDFDDFDDADLREAFSKYGTVQRCELTIDPATNWSRGFGFVSMSKPEEAALAIQMLHGQMLHGKEMKIELTKEDGR